MIRRRGLSAFLVIAGLALASPAFAEPTAADSESALQLYKDGKALRESGDHQGALVKLRAAHALVQTPITATELGRTYVALGQLLEAREILLTVQRMPVRPNESTKAAESRVEAEALAAELRPRLAAITIRVKGVSDGPPKISVDGAVVPAEAASVPRVLNPGPHVVVLEANGQRVQSDVTLAEGQSRDVDIDVPPPAPVPVVPQVTPPPAEAAKWEPDRLVYIGAGTAILGIGVGTITGILTLSKASTLKDTCRDNRCPPQAQSDIDSTSTTGTISTVAFGIGAVGVVIGVVGLLRSGKSGDRTTGLRVVPTANGFSGSF